MTTLVPGWKTIAENPLCLVREYAFGAGQANAFAVALPNRKLLIASPPTDLSATEFDALKVHGEVVALLAINGAHHLGLSPCRTGFAGAVTYAASSASDRIRKKSKDPGPLESLEALRPLLGDKVTVLAVDGCKIGDVILRVQTESGTLLYASDFIANIQTLPNNFLFKLVFKLTDSAPGLKVFRLFFKFFVKDRAAARDFLIREVEAHPPAIMVPAHGNVVTQNNLGPTLISMLRAAV